MTFCYPLTAHSLRNSSTILGADRCILVGETITFECQRSGSIANVNIRIFDPVDISRPSPYTVTATLDNAADIGGNYMCVVDTTGPCGGTRGEIAVVVYGESQY